VAFADHVPDAGIWVRTGWLEAGVTPARTNMERRYLFFRNELDAGSGLEAPQVRIGTMEFPAFPGYQEERFSCCETCSSGVLECYCPECHRLYTCENTVRTGGIRRPAPGRRSTSELALLTHFTSTSSSLRDV
jgi:hypothetical protein